VEVVPHQGNPPPHADVSGSSEMHRVAGKEIPEGGEYQSKITEEDVVNSEKSNWDSEVDRANAQQCWDNQNRDEGVPFCQKCKEIDHYTANCRKGWHANSEVSHVIPNPDKEVNLFGCVSILCATQVEGQGFLCIPDIPSEQNARERINTIVVTMIKGVVTTKQIKEEFTRILPSAWRWIAIRVTDNMFTVRFPNAMLIKEWYCFNSISLRAVKAKIQDKP
jgi:hypothetical protein